MILYFNGPLPEQFKDKVIFDSKKEEFALNYEDTLSYIDWCLKNKFEVIGFDTWILSDNLPLLNSKEHFEGNTLECKDYLLKLESDSKVLYFNIWVDDA